jgi:hypothetical protein
MEKIKKIVKVLTLLVLIFVKTNPVNGQAKTTHQKLAIAHIVKGPKKFDGNHVYFISQLPVDQWQKNDTFQVNDNTFKLYASPSSFIANTEETYNSYRALRIKGFESLIDWFDFSELITVVKGSKLKGIKLLANSRSDQYGNITYGDYKQIDTNWYFLCYAGVPMYKMTGGMEPCLNLTRVMFADDFGKTIPEKPKKVDPEPKDTIIKQPEYKPEAKRDLMLEPCSNVQYEMNDWYVDNGEQIGKFTKEYSNIYWRKSDNIWLQKNGQKWDTICPKLAVKQPDATPKKNSNFVIDYDCSGNAYFQESFFGSNGEKMYNQGEVMKSGYRWYRKGSDGKFYEFCKTEIATSTETKKPDCGCPDDKKSETRTTSTAYSYYDEHCGCPKTRTCECTQYYNCQEHTQFASNQGGFWGFLNVSLDGSRNVNQNYGNQNRGSRVNDNRNRSQIVQRRDGPFDKHQ